jgi:hypothetical protein
MVMLSRETKKLLGLPGVISPLGGVGELHRRLCQVSVSRQPSRVKASNFARFKAPSCCNCLFHDDLLHAVGSAFPSLDLTRASTRIYKNPHKPGSATLRFGEVIQ